jgi:uncharacterized protein YbcI
MASPDRPMTGEPLLEAVSDKLSALHERHYGRRPAAARSRLIDDELLACVMGGVYTDVEKALIELQREPLVREVRSEFQHAMRDRLIAAVEDLSGRRVETFLSTNHVGPDLEVELFVLDRPVTRV